MIGDEGKIDCWGKIIVEKRDNSSIGIGGKIVEGWMNRIIRNFIIVWFEW